MTDFTPVAAQLVDDALGPAGVSRMPDELHDYCVSRVAKRLDEIDKLKNGVVQYGPNGETSFMPSDPLKPVQTILNRYKSLGAVG